MSNLSAFMKPAYTEKKVEVILSDRFLNEDGTPAPFIIKSLSHEAFESIRKRSYKETVINGKKNQVIDNDLWLSRCIVESCIQPDFRDKELCNNYGCEDPMSCPKKMLLEGEIQKLGKAILALNGLDDESPEMGEISKKVDDECDSLLSDDTDADSALAYYLFINHGILPHVVLEMDTREKAFVLAMVRREIRSQQKK